MKSKEDIANLVSEIINQEGYKIHEIDMPTSYSGVLRIYLFSKDKPVSIDACATISRRIANLPEYEEITPNKVTLEISSAGINRVLKTKEHFQDAVGERVKVKLLEMFENKKNILGVLQSVSDDTISVFDNDLKKEVVIKYGNIDKSRVDFDFNQKSTK